MTAELTECLSYDPFQGDESEVVTMSDKIVRANKDHPHCNICHGPIALPPVLPAPMAIAGCAGASPTGMDGWSDAQGSTGMNLNNRISHEPGVTQ